MGMGWAIIFAIYWYSILVLAFGVIDLLYSLIVIKLLYRQESPNHLQVFAYLCLVPLLIIHALTNSNYGLGVIDIFEGNTILVWQLMSITFPSLYILFRLRSFRRA